MVINVYRHCNPLSHFLWQHSKNFKFSKFETEKNGRPDSYMPNFIQNFQKTICGGFEKKIYEPCLPQFQPNENFLPKKLHDTSEYS